MKKKILIITILLCVVATCVFSACTFKQEDILTDKDTVKGVSIVFADGITAELSEEDMNTVISSVKRIGEMSYDLNNTLQGQIEWKYDYTFKLTVERKKFLFFKKERTEYYRFGTHVTHVNDKGETKEYNDDYEWCYMNNSLKYTKQMDKEEAVKFRERFDKINADLRKEKYDGIKETFQNAGYTVSELTDDDLSYVFNDETQETVWVNAIEGFLAVKGEEAYRFYLTDDLERAEAFSSKMSKYGGKNTGCLCGYGNVTDTELLNAIYN